MTTGGDSDMRAILEKIGEITAQTIDDDYIFRGESRCYGKVTSTLYRQYEDEIDARRMDIEIVQAAMLQDAKQYTDETDDFEILTQLQHHGGKTNLVDFTTDIHIALFFACSSFPEEDGRVILQRTRTVIREVARNPKNRVIAQKSVFVRPLKGFIEPEPRKVISIPSRLKQPMLNYLRRHHGISTHTVYNDLHGFIAINNIHDQAYTAFYKGNTALQEKKDYDGAIQHYNESVRLWPDISEPYGNRGIAYGRKGDREQALKDYGKAIELDPTNAFPYANRGNLHLQMDNYDQAVEDCSVALELDSEFADAYYTRGIARLRLQEIDSAKIDLRNAESRGVDLPEDIKAIMTPPQHAQG